LTALVLFALPPLVISHFKYPGATLAMAGVVALLGLSALWVPRGPRVAPLVADGRARAGLPGAAWAALAVFLLFLVGNIGLWAFLERMGAALKIAPTEMGIVFAVLKLLGSVAAFSMAAAGERLGPRRAAWLVLAAVGVGLTLLGGASGFAGFALGAWIWEFAFTCGCVLQTAAIARSDPSGRAVVLVPAAFALGSMIGPGLAGQLVAGGSFGGLLLLALASTLAPVVAGLLRQRRAVACADATRVAAAD
ncbi:MAG TPA: hypothetical protein VLJ86_19005, partial [Ramlibacter sp.]|nr:hypothetical protein [Ramlibacter sp.]